ncbi:hypothetical protein MMC30_000148 [Trapelia coarctata]|nr:hypothetical protein [Trapelia coarctata]
MPGAAEVKVQSRTNFKQTVARRKAVVKDLDSLVHPRAVFGNMGKNNHGVEFKTEDPILNPLSAMAAVYGDKMVYFLNSASFGPTEYLWYLE